MELNKRRLSHWDPFASAGGRFLQDSRVSKPVGHLNARRTTADRLVGLSGSSPWRQSGNRQHLQHRQIQDAPTHFFHPTFKSYISARLCQ
jgi:hypothetical protein